jgi:hypothetical protein
MGRLVTSGQIVYDQIDFYIPAGSINRATGVIAASLSLNIFVDNCLLSWPLADGTNISNFQISAGTVYFNEIAGSSGYYSVRFFPDRIGFWRLIFQNATLSEEAIRSYDVIPARPGPASNELNASFVPQP